MKEYIYFWKDYEENGYLSNWYKVDFIVDNIKFNCMEQFFMYKKAELFKDDLKKQQILKEEKQKYQKALGRQVKNFNKDIWNKEKYNIVKEGLYFKFIQNEDLKNKLLKTNNAILVEASPFDKIWGIGLNKKDAKKIPESDWKGENLLGLALMEVREKIKQETLNNN